ncbi:MULTISPECIES: hypothetical protein [unclassified Streptomyces]|uniref:hypothetical protein n=1 Tax=unclassified Streptomyces TaxID=2593676 RepID=UPI001BEAC772|nr:MULTISPECIES: hypothetical protein [unclassified Streptomyces]MBT2404494.1 hypothetical protein [Streptomyces sp. ISL-21]MBT2608784.1 hypothetical protein [Streptomyces sp. ISL-87]
MRSRTIAATAIGTTALLGLTACAGGEDKAAALGRTARASAAATAPAPSGSAAAPAKGAGLTDLSGAEILTQAYEATRKAESAHVTATVPYEGEPMKINLSLDKKGNCNGAIRLQGMGKLDIIKSTELVHFKGDEAYWRGAAKLKSTPKKQTDQMVATLADRWVKIPASDPRAASMTGSCDLDKLMGGFDRSSPLARKGGTATVEGKPAIAVTSPTKDGTQTDYVATQGTPYIVKSTITGGTDGEAVFSEFGTPVDVTSPKDSDVLDLGKLGGAPGEAV